MDNKNKPKIPKVYLSGQEKRREAYSTSADIARFWQGQDSDFLQY